MSPSENYKQIMVKFCGWVGHGPWS